MKHRLTILKNFSASALILISIPASWAQVSLDANHLTVSDHSTLNVIQNLGLSAKDQRELAQKYGLNQKQLMAVMKTVNTNVTSIKTLVTGKLQDTNSKIEKLNNDILALQTENKAWQAKASNQVQNNFVTMMETMNATFLNRGEVPPALKKLAQVIFFNDKEENIDKNLPILLDVFHKQGLDDFNTLLMAMSYIRINCGQFKPVEEIGGRTKSGDSWFSKYEFKHGNIKPGDGEKYKGRGYLSVTGRGNYAEYSEKLGMGTQLVDKPELMNDSEISARSLALFIEQHKPQLDDAIKHHDYERASRIFSRTSNETLLKLYENGQSSLQGTSN